MNPDRLFDVSNEIVVITGVSGQLGGEYAGVFLQRGARVAGLDMRPSGGSDKLAEAYPGRYLFVSADVTKKASLQSALFQVEEKLGVPSVLINNAAIDSPPSGPLGEKALSKSTLKLLGTRSWM